MKRPKSLYCILCGCGCRDISYSGTKAQVKRFAESTFSTGLIQRKKILRSKLWIELYGN